MKFSTVVLLATGASAQISIYTGVANILGSKVSSLNSVVAAYTGGRSTASFIAAEASDLAAEITFAASVVTLAQPITDFNGALSLLTPYQKVASSFKALASNLVAKESALSANGYAYVISTAIQEESDNVFSQLGPKIGGQIRGDATLARNIFTTSVIKPITSALNSAAAAYTT